MLFKICGLKKIATIDCCEKNKVNFFGMIFYKKSPRFITIKEAEILVNHSRDKNIKPIGVFVDEDIRTVLSFVTKLNLNTIQLHGLESNEYIKKLKSNNIKVIKSISIRNINDLKSLDNYEANDYFLLDYKAKKNELPGGNAKKFDWSLLANIKLDKPWFLSGGINESNINTIKNYINPNGIDLSSGVEEAPGIKNNKKINSLFKKYYEK